LGTAVVDVFVTYDNDDLDATWDAATATTISLAGSIPTITVAGAALATDQVTIAFGSDDLKKGAAYSVWVGGTKVYDFTVSGIVTTLGSGGGMGGGGGGGGRSR
jgi:hypothetical protein